MTYRDPDHERATRMAVAANAAGDRHWFEQLYDEAESGGPAVPWHRTEPNPRLREWSGGRAIVVGCGYGHDAAHLAARGYRVTAFDLSPTAVAAARETYPDIDFHAADVLEPMAEWAGAFDVVFEAYTVQVLRGDDRAAAIAAIAGFVAPGGRLLVVGFRARPDDEPDRIALPLTAEELRSFTTHGLDLVSLAEEPPRDDAPPPRWHWIAEYRRPA
ncbi:MULTISPECIES: class I SAM-dependent methyltransferase [Actinokineospora]|uniref:Methyltransferase type 12 n=1 Tax=Actinokineospora fastidiosa TaxID=1816 RepID=A0A918GMM2_9PSEU|nr:MULTISPECIES: class I SAM-dependent methyltransferase [Actinokineospora]UVS78856.1 biotin biosynthesis protein BioC [Actinokineospora sp. UTMC 2448]GGS47664.1 methyltransferase type 12 [Actinokineospora fastidiosa]